MYYSGLNREKEHWEEAGYNSATKDECKVKIWQELTKDWSDGQKQSMTVDDVLQLFLIDVRGHEGKLK